MPSLNEYHHTVIQALMTKGPLTEDSTKKLVADAAKIRRDNAFHEFIQEINEALEYVQLEIRHGVFQETGVAYYGLVNKVADDRAKLGTRLTHAQVSFFKAIVEAIAMDQEASGSITSIEALNIRPESQGMSQTEAESSQIAAARHLTHTQKTKLLDDLVAQQWLTSSPGGRISIGIKTFLELKSYLKNMEGVPVCELCNEAAIKAQVCSNADCGSRLHWYCAQRKFERAGSARVCAKADCGAAWPMTVGQAASQVEEEEPQQPRRRGRKKSRASS